MICDLGLITILIRLNRTASTHRKLRRHGLILGLMLLVLGCGSSERSPLGKVIGTVTYKGEPVEVAQIVFHNPQGRPATGRIKDGQIMDVTTYDTLNDGAPLGTLKVTIQPIQGHESFKPPLPGESLKPTLKSPFPARYSDPQLSGLEADIQAGTNELSFDLDDE